MPWKYLYDKASDVFVATAWGVISSDDLIAGLTRLRHEPEFHQNVRRFGDYANVDRFELSEKFLAEYARLEAALPANGRYAILSFSPSGSTRFQHFISEKSSGPQRIFISRQEAVDWLNEGVPPEKRLTVAATMLGHANLL